MKNLDDEELCEDIWDKLGQELLLFLKNDVLPHFCFAGYTMNKSKKTGFRMRVCYEPIHRYKDKNLRQFVREPIKSRKLGAFNHYYKFEN